MDETRNLGEVPLGNRLLYWFASAVLWLAGWRVDACLLDVPKYVLIIAPHTSNWDGIFLFLAEAVHTYGFYTVRMSFLAKNSLFRPPLGWLMTWLGGIPVDRRSRHALVDQVIDAFNGRERLIIGITPEGTRKKNRYWKTGFYYIALGAGVPIRLAFADYQRKVAGTGPTIYPSGDIQADMVQIREFYRDIPARHPERVSNIDVRTD